MDSKHEISLYQPDNKGEIILYQPDSTIRLEVRIEDETVWLTQAQMAELFQTTKQNVSLHANNVFKEGELEALATVKDFLTVQNEGGREVFRNIRYYNLDVIISVGYRVKSQSGTKFRQWANSVLKEFLLKGYVIHQRIDHVEKFAIETERRLFEAEIEIERLNQVLEELTERKNKPRNPIGYLKPEN